MKLDILFHYNVDETTGEVTFLGKEEITVDTAAPVKKAAKATINKVVENDEPLITLEPNKLVLTTGAVNLLNANPDCRIDIKYKKKDKVATPVIGTDAAFETVGKGNKLSKSNTVSFRGSANEKLAEFGTTFKLEPSEDNGIFYMIGDRNIVEDEAVDIESELEIDDLDAIDLDTSTDLEAFDFKL